MNIHRSTVSQRYLLAALLVFLLASFGGAEAATTAAQTPKPGSPSGRQSLRETLKPVAKELGLSLIFDISARDVPASFPRPNASSKSDLEEFLQKQKFATGSLDQNILLIYADTPDNKRRIEENKTYSLRSLEANGGADDGEPNQDGLEALRAGEVKGGKYQVAFWNMSRKVVLSRVAESLKFKAVFDESVGDSLLNIDLKDVELSAAIEHILKKRN